MRVTVILSVYNGKDYVASCIESVLAQSMHDFELLIADDGSTDGSSEVLKSFAERDHRIRLHPRGRNLGMGANYSAFFQAARGEYIAQIGHDDIWDPRFLEKMCAWLDARPAQVAAFAGVSVINEDGENGNVNPFEHQALARSREAVVAELLKRNFLCASASLVRRAAVAEWKTLGSNDQFQDWATWQALALRGELGFLNETLVNYRVHGTNLSLGGRRPVMMRLDEQAAKFQVIADRSFADFVLASTDPNACFAKLFAAHVENMHLDDYESLAGLSLALREQESRLDKLASFRENQALVYWLQGALGKATRVLSAMSLEKIYALSLSKYLARRWLICAPSYRVADSQNPLHFSRSLGPIKIVQIRLKRGSVPPIYFSLLLRTENKQTVERFCEGLIETFRKPFTRLVLRFIQRIYD